jgi:hypothetical protein
MNFLEVPTFGSVGEIGHCNNFFINEYIKVVCGWIRHTLVMPMTFKDSLPYPKTMKM